jgi:hypothetical protein
MDSSLRRIWRLSLIETPADPSAAEGRFEFFDEVDANAKNSNRCGDRGRGGDRGDGGATGLIAHRGEGETA